MVFRLKGYQNLTFTNLRISKPKKQESLPVYFLRSQLFFLVNPFWQNFFIRFICGFLHKAFLRKHSLLVKIYQLYVCID